MNINQLEEKLAQRPFSPLFARLAHEYISADRVDDAMKLLLNGVGIHADYSTAYFALSECYLHAHNLPDALDAIDHAIHMNPAVETLRQVRREIQTLHDGPASRTEESESYIQTAPGELDSGILTDTEAPPATPEMPPAEQPVEETTADTLQRVNAPSGIEEEQETEEFPPPDQIKEEDEASISRRLTELLQGTEKDDLITAPSTEPPISGEASLSDAQTEKTEEVIPALTEESRDAEQFPAAVDNAPVPQEETINGETAIDSQTEDLYSLIGSKAEKTEEISRKITEDLPEQKSEEPKTGVDDIHAELEPMISGAFEEKTVTNEVPVIEEEAIDTTEISSEPLQEIPLVQADEEPVQGLISEQVDMVSPAAEVETERVVHDETEPAAHNGEIVIPSAEIPETPEPQLDAGVGTGPQLPADDYRIVSKTLAEIYASQGEYGEALMTYRLLKLQRPELGEVIDKRIDELEKLIHINPQTPPEK